jgi:hypothetical protein
MEVRRQFLSTASGDADSPRQSGEEANSQEFNPQHL